MAAWRRVLVLHSRRSRCGEEVGVWGEEDIRRGRGRGWMVRRGEEGKRWGAAEGRVMGVEEGAGRTPPPPRLCPSRT